MTPDSGSPDDFRQTTRVPVEAPANLQIDAFSEPMSGFTANVSLGGMFVKMLQPPPVGTILRFELQPSDPPGTVRGMAEVVWIRTRRSKAGEPGGMGVQFRFIEEECRPLLRTAVERALERLGPEPEPVPETRQPPRRPHRSPAPERPEPTRPEDRRSTPREAEAKTDRKPAKKQAPPRKILGLPAASAKLVLAVLLLILTAVLFLRMLG